MDKINIDSKTAVFAGSFDPFTIGHYDIALRASRYFDKLIVAVADGQIASERADICSAAIKDIPNCEVMIFSGLLTDFLKMVDSRTIIRGLRNTADFEYEKAMCEGYRSQCADAEVMYLLSKPQHGHISSNLTKELARIGGNIDGYVLPQTKDKIIKIYANPKKIVRL